MTTLQQRSNDMEPDSSGSTDRQVFAGLDYNESIDSVLGLISESQLQLSEMADSKANIMITVCSILLSLAIAKIEQGELVWPLSIFVVCCIPALVFAILTVLPSSSPQQRPVDDVSKLRHFNPLFFQDFTKATLSAFEGEMDRVLSSPQALYQALSRDIYYAGVVIGKKKYRYLRWSYVSLLLGLGAGGIALLFVIVAG